MIDWTSGKASLIFIPIIAAIVAVFAAIAATVVFLLGSWADQSYFTLRDFLFLFKMFSFVGSFIGVYMLILGAAQELDSWLYKLASGLFYASLMILMLAAFLFSVEGLHSLSRRNFSAFLVLLAVIAYAICFWAHSWRAKEVRKRRGQNTSC